MIKVTQPLDVLNKMVKNNYKKNKEIFDKSLENKNFEESFKEFKKIEILSANDP